VSQFILAVTFNGCQEYTVLYVLKNSGPFPPLIGECAPSVGVNMLDFTFDPDTIEYSTKNAFALSRAALLAYEGPEHIARTIKKWGMKGFHVCDNGGTQALVIADDTKIIVAFRGTEPTELEDWFTNIQTSKTPVRSGSVHTGFLKALQLVWKCPTVQHDVFATIKQLRTNHQSIWFTGHSLGAALATLAMAKLWWEDKIAANGLYTFGSPRVGDSEFVWAVENRFGSRIFRFVNHDDIVPRVPFYVRGYSHVGILKYLNSAGNLRAAPSWRDRLKQWFKQWFKFGASYRNPKKTSAQHYSGCVRDHFMVAYRDCLFRLWLN